ncbi:MAG: methyltransferase [Candidatus Thorarchaeota archaeon]
MNWVWGGMSISGLFLVYWSVFSLPKGTDLMPRPPLVKVKNGPYRLLKHPMYIGNVVLVSGLGGLAAGIWNALALGIIAGMVMEFWAGLEGGR